VSGGIVSFTVETSVVSIIIKSFVLKYAKSHKVRTLDLISLDLMQLKSELLDAK